MMSKSIIRSISVTRSQVSAMFDKWRVALHMLKFNIVMEHLGERASY